MKNFIITMLLISCFSGVSHYEHNYIRKNCKITQINDGIATIEDKCGFYWDWEIETDDLKVGDVVNLKMNDNNTINYIDDDIITKIIKK